MYQERANDFFESGFNRVNWQPLWATNELLWYSERTDWGHLYLYDLATGRLKNPITSGSWKVLQVLRLDTASRTIFFTAAGREPGDPYFRKLSSVRLDGSRLQLLTPEDADHDVTLAPDGRCFVLTGGSPRLYQVDPTTGAKLHKWTLTGAGSLESLVWSPDGNTLYSAADRGDFKDLVRIDLATSTITFVSAQHSGFEDIEALAWVSAPTARLLASWGGPTDAVSPRAGALLHPNVPNPFNPTTSIEFSLPVACHVYASIINDRYETVQVLFCQQLDEGLHLVHWSAMEGNRELPSDVYRFIIRCTDTQGNLLFASHGDLWLRY